MNTPEEAGLPLGIQDVQEEKSKAPNRSNAISRAISSSRHMPLLASARYMAPADRTVRLERRPEARGDAHGSADGDHGGDHQEEKDLVRDFSGHGPPLFSGDCLTP